jgi:hypothetical protein
MESWAAAKKVLVWRCHQLLSGFLVKIYLPRLSRQLLLSPNDKLDNEMVFEHCVIWLRDLDTKKTGAEELGEL